MSDRKNMAVFAGCVLAVSLIAASVTAFFLSNSYRRMYIRALGEICQGVIERQPEAERAVLETLKEYRPGQGALEEENVILAYGYGESGFWQQAGLWQPAGISIHMLGVAGLLAGGAAFLFVIRLLQKRNMDRVKQLTDYLEKVNTGGNADLFQVGEDDFSRLQDEIYKTVTELYRTREAALAAKNNFAENLYNIAHQIKTPITSLSLSIQMMQEKNDKIQYQLAHLARLTDGLLLLSRIEAGTLPLEKKEIDVFTVLTLAADNLQELSRKAGVSIEIPEAGPMVMLADMEWTMEAVINLLKNGIEHTPSGGTVYCAYDQNPLYTRIRIWDTGAGFDKEDIPHLFERFYRGKRENAVNEAMSGKGIGIGLALAKAIIESQNGTIHAGNLPEGGACFEIHMYCH